VLSKKISLPPLNPIDSIESSSQNGKEPKNDGKQLSDLSWSEKEKVLRVLFAKMNGTSLTRSGQKAEKIRDHMDEIRQTTSSRRKSGFSNASELPPMALYEEDHDFDSHILTDNNYSERELESHTEEVTTTMDTRSEYAPIY
jgi:hypothetical protein